MVKLTDIQYWLMVSTCFVFGLIVGIIYATGRLK